MIEGEGILCFAPEPWGSMWRSRQHIMAELAKHNKVLFVEPRAYLRPTIKGIMRGSIGLREVTQPLLRRVSDGLYLFRPPVLAPVSERFPLSTATDFVRTSLLRLAMRRLGIAEPLLWLERPDVRDQVGKFDEKLLIYRVVDEYTAYADVTPDTVSAVERGERWLLERADLVLVASEALLASKRAFNSNTHLLSHGVDYEAYARAAADARHAPEEVARLSRPIIGYAGLVSRRLDLQLLGRIALAKPSWTIVLVGDVNPLTCGDELEGLKNLPNIRLLGRRDVREVPSYIQSFDVCLIPYRPCAEAHNANPLKLLEYLACGKPTVSIDTPAVRTFSHLVKIANGADAFVRSIAEALEEKDEALALRRREVAQRNSWARVAERLSTLIEERLRAKEPGRDRIWSEGR